MELGLVTLLIGLLCGYGVGIVIGWLGAQSPAWTFKHAVSFMFGCLIVALALAILI